LSEPSPVRVQVLRLPEARDLPLPERATALSAGFDLRASLTEALVIPPLGRALVPTGIALALPSGYEAQVRPRSGLAWKTGLTLLNSPGTVDADYRGEVKVVVVNLGDAPATIRRGERIAQLVVHRLPEVSFEAVAELAPTRRGAGGFGHTGEV
jgi:dUTP pyrophosphatase